MEKVYGNGHGRAMRPGGTGKPRRAGLLRAVLLPRGLSRTLILALCVQLAVLPALAGTARATEMMLMEEKSRDSAGYGWLFVGLALVTYAVAANDYEESRYNLQQARNAYDHYKHATNAADALYFRDQTTTYSHRAQAYESTTNATFLFGTVFLLTAIAIFRSDGKPDQPMLLSDRGVQWTYRF